MGCVPDSSNAISANGGTLFQDVPGYNVHQYTSSPGSSVTFGRDVVADVLLIGGGGGGGYNAGGGGGAGADLYYSGFKFSSGTTYTFVVGGGGSAGTASAAGGAGGDTSITISGTSFFIAKGGGGGGRTGAATTGGSGGGASSASAASGASAVNTNVLATVTGYTLGNSGGTSIASYAGGGGGANGAGGTASGTTPGSGGSGVYQRTWSGNALTLATLFGSAYTNVASLESDGFYYVGGGGGGGGATGASAGIISGGRGGGGNGLNCASGASGTAGNGRANTGSGGGGGGQGSCQAGTTGGSGLILLRYSLCQPCKAGTRLQNAGSTGSCTACMSGTYSGPGQSACSSCPADSGSPVAAEKCYASAGKYPKFALVGTQSSEVINLARSCGASSNSACDATTSSQYGAIANFGPQFGNDGLISVAADAAGSVGTNTNANNWWRVDFGSAKNIVGGKFVNLITCCQTRMDNFKIWVGSSSTYNGGTNTNCYTHSGTAHSVAPYTVYFPCVGSGQYVFIHTTQSDYLSFNELEVYPLITTTVTSGQLLVVNNDFVSDTFWGLSGSVSIVFPQWMHPSVLLGSPQIPPAISDNDYPVVTETTGKVVQPYIWWKFDSASCTGDSGSGGYTLGSSLFSSGTIATCQLAKGKRGDSGANFVTGSKQHFRITDTQARSMGLPTIQSASGITIVFWARILTTTPQYSRIIELSTFNAVESGGEAAYFVLYMDTSPDIKFRGQGASDYYDLTGVVDNNWHFYQWSIDSSTATNANAWTISVDNVKKVAPGSAVTKSSAMPAPASGKVYAYNIGRGEYGGGWLDGNMDDIRIYRGVLTDAQVTTLYQGRVGLYNATFGSCPDSATACVAGVNGSKHCDKFGGGVCCGAGYYLQDGSDSACTSCPAGTYSTDGAGTSCTVCAAGTWSGAGASAAASCTGCGSATCAAGSYKRCVNASASLCCGGGSQQYFVEGTHTACQTCPSGLYGDGSGTTCLDQCPAGQYMDGSCKNCPAGFYRATPGATSLAECLACTTGVDFASSPGSGACTACSSSCQNGKYITSACNTTRDIVCSDCTNLNLYGVAYTSPGTTPTNCQYSCAAGAFWNGSACSQCPPGTFQDVTDGYTGTSCTVIGQPPSNIFVVGVGNGGSTLNKYDLNTPNIIKSFTLATSNGNSGVCISPDGSYVLVVNANAHNIQKVVFSNSSVTTVAGSAGSGGTSGRVDGTGTAARFNTPETCQISSNGNYALIADEFNNAIRKLDLSTFDVSTVAGTCSGNAACTSGSLNGPGLSSTFNKPYGIDIHPNGNWAIITERTGKNVRSMSLVDGVFTTGDIIRYASGTGLVMGLFNSARLSSPYHVRFTGDGNKALVVDTNNPDIVQLDFLTSTLSVLCNTTCVGGVAYTSSIFSASWAARGDYIIFNDYTKSKSKKYVISNKTTSDFATGIVTQPMGIDIWRCNTAGFGSDTNSETCVQCPAGKYNGGTGWGGGLCMECPAGKYSVARSSNCTSCAAGFYRATAGATSLADCLACTTGVNFSSSPGSGACTACSSSCQNGKYISSACSTTSDIVCSDCTNKNTDAYSSAYTGSGTGSGSSNCPYNCVAGAYRANTNYGTGAACARCGTGTYQVTAGFEGTACTDCTAGKYSATLQATTADVCTNCTAGSYQALTGKSNCTLCVKGKASALSGASTAASCLDCAIGTYTATDGLSTCVGCTAGSNYQSLIGQTGCLNCSGACGIGLGQSVACNATADKICSACTNTDAQRFAYTAGGPSVSTCPYSCNAGYYKASVDTGNCTSCGTGKYQATAGYTGLTCTNCSAGKYSANTAQVSIASCLDCPRGSYGVSEAQSVCTNCTKGQFSSVLGANSTTVCTNCAAGTISAADGASVCTTCTNGTSFAANTGLSACTTCAGACTGNQYLSSKCNVSADRVCSACTNLNVLGVAYTGPSPVDLASLCPYTCRVGAFQAKLSTGTVLDSTVNWARKCGGGQNSACTVSVNYASGVVADVVDGVRTSMYTSGTGSIPVIMLNLGTARTVHGGAAWSGDWNHYGGFVIYVGSSGAAYNNAANQICFDSNAADYFTMYQKLGQVTGMSGVGGGTPGFLVFECAQAITGQYVYFVRLFTDEWITLNELEIYSYTSGVTDTTVVGCKSCPGGLYQSTDANAASNCTNCNVGTYNPISGATNVGDCKSCNKGTYQNVTGQSACVLCGANTYNSATGSNSSAACTPCPQGSVSSQLGATSNATCGNCGAGNYVLLTACLPCSAGSYQALGGQTLCTVCESGKFESAQGKSTCTLCPAGTASNRTNMTSNATCARCAAGSYAGVAGLSACVPCEAGKFQTGTGTSACDLCGNGTFSVTVNATSNATCVYCAPGRYGPAMGLTLCPSCDYGQYQSGSGLSVCSLCAAGTYGPTQGSNSSANCLLCAGGKFQTGSGRTAEAQCDACVVGKFSTASGANASSACSNCSAGTFQNQTATTVCSNCSAGTYQAGTGFSSCTLASLGYFVASAGQSAQSACAEGTYSYLQGMTYCSLCRAGTFQPLTAQTAVSACQNCGAGKYSAVEGLNQSSGCLLCGNATYSTVADLNSSSGCKGCPANAGNQGGGVNLQSCVCNAGYSGANGGNCTLCNRTVYCMTGTANNCPQFSQALQAGASLKTDCYCNAGYYGYALIAGNPCAYCPADSYCPGGAVNYTVACPYGQKAYGNSTTSSACFCPANAETGPGAYNENACTCKKGYKKVTNASSPLFGWSCQLCAQGEICVGGINSTCPQNSQPQASGQVNSYLDCTCVAGFYNTTVQNESVMCQPCPANSYCLGGGHIAGCPGGATQVSTPQSPSVAFCLCLNGTAGIGNVTCSPCSPGKYCILGQELNCPQNMNSPASSTVVRNCSCNAGYYGDNGGACLSCPAGKYNLIQGCYSCQSKLDTDCIECHTGTYSTALARNTTCDLCGAGKYLDLTGQDAESDCKLCWTGTYQTGLGMITVANCSLCGTGSFQTGSGMPVSANCSLCGAGTFQTGSGMPAASDCSQCVAGTFQTGSGMSAASNCSECGSGTYSVAKASSCKSCPVNSNSGSAAAACVANAGYYNLGTNQISFHPFNADDILADMSGNDNTLTSDGTTVGSTTNGPWTGNDALVLDGNGYLKIPNLYLNEKYTFCVWHKFTGMTNGSGYPASIRSYLSAFRVILRWSVFDYLANPILDNVMLNAWYMGYMNGGLSNGVKQFNVETWYHSCIAGYKAELSGYYTGSPTQYTDTILTEHQNGTVPVYIGADTTYGMYQNWIGHLDDVRWFNKRINSDEYMAIYNSRDTYSNVLPVPCPAGTYRTQTGATSISDCQLCGAGTFQTGTGMALASDCTACGAGTFQTGLGMTLASYCAKCGAGTFQTGTGMANASNCTLCSAGTYQTGLGAWNLTNCTLCSAGKYQNATGAILESNCRACAAGKVQNSSGAISESNCTACSNGSFTASDKVQQCWPCPNFSTSSAGSDRCQCGGGYAGTILKSTDTCKECTSCDPNAETFGVCDPVTKFDNVSCACYEGYYGDGFLCTACAVCDTNAVRTECPYNSSSDVSTCSCNQGYYGDGRSCTACAACDANAARTKECAAGSASDVSTCSCNAGYYGDGRTCTACAACDANATRVECSAGSTADSSTCSCNAGLYGDGRTCSPCRTCHVNSTQTQNCLSGSQTDVVVCACNAGFWGTGFVCQACKTCDGNAQQLSTCPFNSTSDTSGCGCQNGFYGDGLTCSACRACDSNARVLATCLSGTTADTSACECLPGYFSVTGFNCTACPQGTWGSGGTFCVPCGKGLYSDETNQTSNATCLPCPKDTYAPREASGNLSTACLPCPQYSTTAETATKSRVECKCAPGYLNFISESGGDCTGCGENQYPSESQSSCLPCPANTASPTGSKGIWQCAANAGYYARYTKTVNMIVEVPEEDSDPLVVEAVLRAAAGGGDDVTVRVENVP